MGNPFDARFFRRLSENTYLPFDKPFDRLTVLSSVEGLMALSKVEGLRLSAFGGFPSSPVTAA
jgi:hypothetical protein